MLYAILFMFSTADHPAQMQSMTHETWATLEACETVLENEGAKFAQFMQMQNIQMTNATGECVVDTRGGRGA
jgi:hypothetical protein